MPLCWNPLICCPTAHYFPNDIWDATVKGTERSISPAFQSNLLWEGNNMSISEREKKNWLDDPLSECGLGAWNRSGSGWCWESFSIFLQNDAFPSQTTVVESGGAAILVSLRLFLIGREIFSFETPVLKKLLCKNKVKKKKQSSWVEKY